MTRMLFFCLLLAADACAQDWPRWRGTNGDGRWNPLGLPADFAKREPQRLWKTPLGPGFGGVTTAKGLAYVMDRQKASQEVERVLCLDEKSGSLKPASWKA